MLRPPDISDSDLDALLASLEANAICQPQAAAAPLVTIVYGDALR